MERGGEEREGVRGDGERGRGGEEREGVRGESRKRGEGERG